MCVALSMSGTFFILRLKIQELAYTQVYSVVPVLKL